MTESSFDVDRFRKGFLLMLVAGISLTFLAMVWDFATTLLLAAIITGLSYPLYVRLVALFRGHEPGAAAATVAVVFFLIIGPVLGLLSVVAGQAIEVAELLTPWISTQVQSVEGKVSFTELQLPDFLAAYEGQIVAKAGELASVVGQFMLDGLAGATRGTAQFLLLLFIMLYSMFFFLRDGHGMLSRILYYMPLRSEDELRLVDRFASVTRATLKGTLVVGGVQGALAGLAFWVVGIPGAVFWGTIMAVLSVIPGLGTAFVWVPAAIWLFATGQVGAGTGLTIWCAGVVGTVDNVLRPRLVGRDTKLSDLLILLSTLGGLIFFGPEGFIIGPILGALFVTVWELYGEAFADYLPEADLSGPGAATAAVEGEGE
jgi:predicted PurR-regulated permease PerM